MGYWHGTTGLELEQAESEKHVEEPQTDSAAGDLYLHRTRDTVTKGAGKTCGSEHPRVDRRCGYCGRYRGTGGVEVAIRGDNGWHEEYRSLTGVARHPQVTRSPVGSPLPVSYGCSACPTGGRREEGG
jgi:hypothetical protein